MAQYDSPKGIDLPAWYQPGTFLRHPQERPFKGFDLHKTIPTHELYEGDCPIPITTRAEWGALDAINPVPHNLPLNHVRYTHTGTAQCSNKEECTKLLQDLQKEHQKEGLSDIKFNFMIDPQGVIYEGRGWDFEADRPDNEMNIDLRNLKGRSCDIAFVGNYDNTMSTVLPHWAAFAAFHLTTWASRHNILGDFFSVTQLRIPLVEH